MYGPEPDNSLNPAFTSTSGILQERNTHHCPPSPSRTWIDHISESSRRRHEVYLLKQRKEKLRRRRMVRRREYQRLRNMVPSIAKKPAVSKVTVIEEAIRYIDYLHGALLTRLRTKGLPSCLRGIDIDVDHLSLEDIKALVCQLVEKNNQLKKRQQQQQQRPNSSGNPNHPQSVFERSRQVPSYLAKKTMRKRT